MDTGSRSVPVKNNQRVVGGGGSHVERFIQESSPTSTPRHLWYTKEKWERMEEIDKKHLRGEKPEQVQKKRWHLSAFPER